MKRIDLTSPVEILACELPRKDYAACDLTLYNLSGDQVTSVEVTLTLQDDKGEEIARLIHRARSLNGAPGRTFIMVVPAEDMTRARQWEATVDKVWFDNSSIWRRSKNGLTDYEPNDLEPSNALNDLRTVAGEDAVGYPAERDGLWLCVCGRPNDARADACVRCQRPRGGVFARYTKQAVEKALSEHETRLSEHGKKTVADSSEKQLEREKEFRRKRRRRRLIIGAVAAVVVLAGGAYAGMAHIGPMMRYQSAVTAFNSGDFDQAAEAFQALEGYKDSDDYVLRCRYEAAKAQLAGATEEQIAEARAAFVALGEYEDAAAMVSQCDYELASLRLQSGDIDGAETLFTALGDYQDSAEQLKYIAYLRAFDLLEGDDYEQAREAFGALGDYAGAADLVQESWYRQAIAALTAEDPDAALTCLAEIPGYQEADELAKQAHYMRAVTLREEADVSAAAAEFLLAGDYEDAAQQANECYYAPAMAAYEAGQYDRAAELFGYIRGYEDVDDKWADATYEAAKRALKDHEYTRAGTLLSSLPEDYEDVAGLRQESIYRPALEAYDRGEYETALSMFESIAGYSDADAQANRSRYAIAEALYQQGNLAGATEQFAQLGDYSDAAKRLQAVQYVQAGLYLDQGTAEGYQQAIDAYAALDSYSDSADKLKQAQFGQADLLLNDGHYAEARPIFEALGSYGEAAKRVQACDYALAADLYAQGQIEEAAALYQSISSYGDAADKAKAIRYEQAAKASDPLTAARYYEQAGSYEDARAKADELYQQYYGEPAAQAQAAYDRGDYAQCAALLRSLDMTDLPAEYANLPDRYKAACYEAGNQLYNEGKPYEALAYYREIPGYRNVNDRLQRACYLILGAWTDLDGVVYVFSDDGTLTIGGEKLYFTVDGTTLRTGASPDALADTHRLSGVTKRNAWLFDKRSGTEVTIYLTKDEAAAAALAEAAAAVAEPAKAEESAEQPAEEAPTGPAVIPLPEGTEE